MIPVSTAKKLVSDFSKKGKKRGERLLSTKDAQLAKGCILAKDIYSPIDMPPFQQSAMDGYALNIGKDNVYQLIGEVKAGDDCHFQLKKGETIRIFTGAIVPESANAVMRQEGVIREKSQIILNEKVYPFMNIRARGEQFKANQRVLDAGVKITPSIIGLLSSMGVEDIIVRKPPSVAIVITGNELVLPPKALTMGKIYESNGAMLKSVLKEIGINEVTMLRTNDEWENTYKTLKKALTHDVILVSGGISVGDYDIVSGVLKSLNTEEIFYKVNQKPGKPLFFGKNNDNFVFGLPGNPAATLICFYVYVLPLIMNLQGAKQTELLTIQSKILTDCHVKGDRAQFLKAKQTVEGVIILEGQSSAILHSFDEVNALVYLPEYTTKVSEGSLVTTMILGTI